MIIQLIVAAFNLSNFEIFSVVIGMNVAMN